jgi:uncharacterized protein YlxP (DUF503 family)
MPIGLSYISLHLPSSQSLKFKRHLIKPILSRLHREFNISVVEYDRLDAWQQAVLGIALISNDHKLLEQVYHAILEFFPSHWPDIQIVEENLEIID